MRRNKIMLNKNYLIKPREAAEILDTSKSTIYRWFWEDKLEGVKIGENTIRIFKSSIKEILDGKEKL